MVLSYDHRKLLPNELCSLSCMATTEDALQTAVNQTLPEKTEYKTLNWIKPPSVIELMFPLENSAALLLMLFSFE